VVTIEGMVMAFLRPLKKIQKIFSKALLTLIAAFLIFGGPTYLLYILDRLGIPRLLILLAGLAAFTAGVILLARLSIEEGKVKAST